MLVTKLVCKTIGITLLVVILAISAFLGVLSLASPLTMAQAYDKLGWYSASIYFYDRHYAGTGSVDALDELISKLDLDNDSVRAEIYLDKMLNHEDYDTFCAEQDSLQAELVITTDEYYSGKYVLSLVKNGKFDTAKSFCATFVTENGYTENNPFRTLIYNAGEKLNSEQLQLLSVDLGIYSATITEPSQLANVVEDALELHKLQQEITQ